MRETACLPWRAKSDSVQQTLGGGVLARISRLSAARIVLNRHGGHRPALCYACSLLTCARQSGQPRPKEAAPTRGWDRRKLGPRCERESVCARPVRRGKLGQVEARAGGHSAPSQVSAIALPAIHVSFGIGRVETVTDAPQRMHAVCATSDRLRYGFSVHGRMGPCPRSFAVLVAEAFRPCNVSSESCFATRHPLERATMAQDATLDPDAALKERKARRGDCGRG